MIVCADQNLVRLGAPCKPFKYFIRFHITISRDILYYMSLLYRICFLPFHFIFSFFCQLISSSSETCMKYLPLDVKLSTIIHFVSFQFVSSTRANYAPGLCPGQSTTGGYQLVYWCSSLYTYIHDKVKRKLLTAWEQF